MPEKPKDGWGYLQPQDIETHLSRLGNLAVLQAQKNSDIGNLSFSDKAKIYKKSSYLLTSQLGDLSAWDTDAIERRQKVLAELAVKAWKI